MAPESLNTRTAIILLYVGLITAFSVGFGAFLLDATQEYDRLKRDEAASQARLQEAQAKLDRQTETLKRLREDPDYVEKVIRRRLGYAKPGDVIFRFEN